MQKSDNLKIEELSKEIAKIETFEKNSEERTNLLGNKIDQIKSTIGDTDAQLQLNYELKQKVTKMEKTLAQKVQESFFAVGENLSKVITALFVVCFLFCVVLSCLVVLYCVFYLFIYLLIIYLFIIYLFTIDLFINIHRFAICCYSE